MNITPYRAQQLVNIAADASNRIVNNKYAYSITFEEIKIVLGLIEKTVNESEDFNKNRDREDK